MAEPIILKDLLFNRTRVQKIAGEIHSAHPSFQKDAFVRACVNKFPELELKARITWIATCLKEYLPEQYPKAVSILVKALPKPNNPNLTDNDFGEFIYAPYGEFVAKYGCTKEYLHISLQALKEITQRFSAEDAIRYFINAFPKETMKELSVWIKDSHYHVRRLCSEGTRPSLPWSQKISLPVDAPLVILNKLFADTTRYVTRSVANHINDIAKKNPTLAMDTLQAWKDTNKQKPAEMDFIIRHALRTLIKKGDKRALAMLGFAHGAKVTISKWNVPKQVHMNTALEFSFIIESPKDTAVLIDYIITFQNKKGNGESKKVFKLKTVRLSKNKPVVIEKRHMMREHMTTRTLYPGIHQIELQVNGVICEKGTFKLW